METFIQDEMMMMVLGEVLNYYNKIHIDCCIYTSPYGKLTNVRD